MVLARTLDRSEPESKRRLRLWLRLYAATSIIDASRRVSSQAAAPGVTSIATTSSTPTAWIDTTMVADSSAVKT